MMTTGFAHNAALSNAEKIIVLIKSGKMKHIFPVGGCDGAHPRTKLLHRVRQADTDGFACSDPCVRKLQIKFGVLFS